MPSLLTPDRSMSAGPRCDKPVQGDGIMSYHCTLPQGHDLTPSSDPEPCYAVESARSGRSWDAWKRRQGVAVAEDTKVIGCPNCGEDALVVDFAKGSGKCEHCGAEAAFQQDLPQETIEQIAEPGEPWKVLEAPNPEAQPRIEYDDTEIMEAARAFDPATAPPLEEDEGESHFDRFIEGLPADERPGAMLANQQVAAQQQPEEMLRTRPGDQVLPDGDESLEDDQTLLIRDIEARRQVGIQRYRQGHRPFNGRNTVQDWYEEQLDGLVYARSILRMHEADRETLVKEVTKVLNDLQHTGGPGDLTTEHVAEVAVDRIMGWVTAQRLNQEGQ